MRVHRAVALGLVAACCSTGPDYPRADEVVWERPHRPRREQTLSLPDGARIEYVTGNDGFGYAVSGDPAVPEIRRGSIRCLELSGRVRWSLDEPDRPPIPEPPEPAGAAGGTNPLAGAFYFDPDGPRGPVELAWSEAALAADATRLYVVQFCSLTNGASIVAIDLASGAIGWTSWVRGLGPVIHSRYSNVVAARVVRGALVVFGDEAGGEYVEVFSPDGTMLSTVVR